MILNSLPKCECFRPIPEVLSQPARELVDSWSRLMSNPSPSYSAPPPAFSGPPPPLSHGYYGLPPPAGRVGKNPGLKKNQPSGFFVVFCFFWFFYIYVHRRESF
jgi:hypothetical protein